MPHTPTAAASRSEDEAQAFPFQISNRADTTKGVLGVTIAGSVIRALTFDWIADANGDVESIISWPIIGTLLMLRHQPVAPESPGTYSIRLLDELHMVQGDILGRQGLSLPSVGSVQRDKPLYVIHEFGTDGVTTVQTGIPCVTTNIKLMIESATASTRCITKLFWRPEA